MPEPTPIRDDILALKALLEKATPGPYRAHDHENMRQFGDGVEKWVGYAWVGRLTKDSKPDGTWDAGWFESDRRKDGCKEYRERASVDAHLIAAALNALPDLIAHVERMEAALEPFADYHGDLPDYDSPLRCVFESGVQYAVELLAKELGVDDWEACDGTEEFDGDLGGTMMNIVMAALPLDEHGDPMRPSEICERWPTLTTSRNDTQEQSK